MIERKSHPVAGVFVFLLLGVFAVFGTVLVLLGAQAYRGIMERTAVHNESRIMEAYVRHVVRGASSDRLITVQELDGVPMLLIPDTGEKEEAYCMWIYAYDGVLYELYTDADSEFTLGSGNEICQAVSFIPQINEHMLTVTMEDVDGVSHTADIVLYGRM